MSQPDVAVAGGWPRVRGLKDLSNGIPADIVQIVKENCQTLRFESYSFEEM